jgi:hypothetical protein
MLNRKKSKVALAVCSLLATAGFAMADQQAPQLTMDSSVVNLDDAAPRGLLMGGLDKIGAAKPLDDIGLNIYGFVETGYTANLRNDRTQPSASNNAPFFFPGSSRPGPFTTEPGNHLMLNQLDLRFERTVDASKGKWDVGGMVELNYGTDSNWDQSNGTEIQTNQSKHLDDSDNQGETPILDVLQSYVDIAVPVGSGIKVRAGRFVTLLSEEVIDPRGNAFYSHSYLFNAVAFTQTGVLGTYVFTPEWTVTAGITRGWDQSTEDNNAAIDFLGQVVWTINKQFSLTTNLSVGPQDGAASPAPRDGDNGHYRTAVDPILTYAYNDKLSFAVEALYIYDGNYAGTFSPSGNTTGYGDFWGAAGYVSYVLSPMFTLNGRIEGAHDDRFGASQSSGMPVTRYEITAGVKINPLTDPIGKNLTIRPEIRYDFTDADGNNVANQFTAGASSFRDNWTAAADVIFTY